MTATSGAAGGRSGPEYGPAWSASLRRGSDAELRGWVEAALAWCDAADEVALRHFRQNPVTTRKPDRSFVTEADTAAHTAFVATLGGTLIWNEFTKED